MALTRTSFTPGHHVGMKSKYNEVVHEALLELIGKGVPRAQAFRACGLSYDTYYNWRNQAREDVQRVAEGGEAIRPHLVTLFEDIEQTEAHAIAERVARIEAAGKNGTWQADAWWLERVHAQEFGRKSDIAIKREGSDGPRVTVNQVILGDSAAREASRELLRSLSPGTGTPKPIGPGDGDIVEHRDGDIVVEAREAR